MSPDQARIWRDRGSAVPVAVDFSARVLDDAMLRQRIERMLAVRGLGAGSTPTGWRRAWSKGRLGRS